MEYNASETLIRNELKKYCKEVNKYYKAGNIETSFNKPVIDLMQSFGCTAHDFSGGREGKKGENIDILLWHINEEITEVPPFGGIEVKKVGGEDARARENLLPEVEKYGNVILTDNVVWKFYRNRSAEMYSGFALLVKNAKGEYELDESKIELFIATIKDFILEKPTNIRSPKKLAYYMAEYARTIKTIVFNIFQSANTKSVPMFNELNALFSRLKQDLLPDLSIKEFADMYAQTIVYGLFIARYNDKSLNTFSRGEAIENLAKESHLLKQFFQHVATSHNLHQTLDEIINKLCNLFTLTNLQLLLNQYEKKDTIVHFYEDFLTYYDLEQKKNFGAYYTPVQVVRFIIEMVDKVLIEDFEINGGLSNNETISIKVKSDPYLVNKKEKTEKIIDVPKVAILDPACGTGTFGAEIIKFIKDKYFSGGNEIFYKDWLQQENGLMSRLIAFEIMMTSYVIAHLKIRRVISETLENQKLDKELPSNIFLTNTLAEPKSLVEQNAQIGFFDFSGAITDEAENADKWKARRPIQVIIGNPPYLAASKNQYDISAYKYEVDGKTKLKERNPKWLNDDYVKFIRFSEQHILKDGKGVLAFITNNGYLDNPTFRGMRASLLRTFDKIYIVNLHGNSMKKETAPDGSKDENVFDIMVGVSIIIGVKTTTKEDFAKVYYSEIYGTRERKFELIENKTIAFKEMNPDDKMAAFIPQGNADIQNEYNKGVSLVDLFNIYSAGIVTGRDGLCVQNSKKDIENVIEKFQGDSIEKLRHSFNLGKDTRDWSVAGAKKELENNLGKICKISYRIFDDRWTYFTGNSKGFHCMPRGEVMRNFSNNNIALCFTRTDKSQRPYSMIFVTNKITESCYLTTQTSGIATIVPLYINSSNMLNSTSNLKTEYYTLLTQNLEQKPTAEEVFDYCYGVLYNLNYRKKFNEFLKRDYPRVPIIENEVMFKKYVEAGNRLRKLHLMETNAIKELSIESSDNNLLIEQVKYKDGKLYINKNTAIIGITEEIFNYYIGGYQVIDKWLKSHKGEVLNYDNFTHIKKIAGIIEETIKIQRTL